jgi:acetyltransferase-like isoleucine patch superfamily enzyme
MPVQITVESPDENDIRIDPYFIETGTGYVSVKGRGNCVRIGRPSRAGSAHFVAENGASICVEDGCALGAAYVYALAPGAAIHIGGDTGFNGTTYITAHEPATIRIGRGCLFGPDCSLTSSDVHKIFDLKKGRRLNPAGDIILGDRVWLAARVVVFRNSVIGNDSVVGWASVVKGRFPSNVVLAGAPAKIVKKGVRWEP